MTSKYNDPLRVYAASALVDSINNASGNFSNNFYLFLSNAVGWVNPLNPPDPDISHNSEYSIRKNIIAFAKIDDLNSCLAINRYDWASGTTYQKFDSKIPFNQYTEPFYCINKEFDIFLCIDNIKNELGEIQASTSYPSVDQSSFTNTFRTSDGYIWKYLASVPQNLTDRISFSYVPVVLANSDSGNQYLTQQTAKSRSISSFDVGEFAGEGNFDYPVVDIVGDHDEEATAIAYQFGLGNSRIQQIFVTYPGSGYSEDVYGIVRESGVTGSGASASIDVDSDGFISGINLEQNGSGYTDAVCIIVGNGTGAEATVSISGGVVSSVNLTNPGSGYDADTKAYIIPGRSAVYCPAILAPVQGHGKNILTELIASTVIVNLKLDSSFDNYIGQGIEFNQIGLISELKDAAGNLADLHGYVGEGNPDYQSKQSLAADCFSGDILYLNNRTSIIRTVGQTEDFKLSICF